MATTAKFSALRLIGGFDASNVTQIDPNSKPQQGNKDGVGVWWAFPMEITFMPFTLHFHVSLLCSFTPKICPFRPPLVYQVEATFPLTGRNSSYSREQAERLQTADGRSTCMRSGPPVNHPSTDKLFAFRNAAMLLQNLCYSILKTEQNREWEKQCYTIFSFFSGH